MGMPSTKFSWGRVILLTLLGLCVSFIFGGIMKYYYSFHKLNEDTYGRFFYTWKSKHAKNSLLKTWDVLKKNSWDTQNTELNDFVEKAQGKEPKTVERQDTWLHDYFPEHFPRYPQLMYYTYNFDWNKNTFLPLRKHMIKVSLENDKKNKEKLEEFDRKEMSPPSLFWDLQNFKLKDDATIDADLKTRVNKTTKKLHALLSHIIKSGENDKILDDTKTSNRIIELTFELFQSMDYDHMELEKGKTKVSTLTKDNVLDFWKNLGRVSSTPYESFVYTRIFFLFYFHTTSMERNDTIEKQGKKEIKRKENPKETLVSRHKDFAKIMSKAFKAPSKKIGSFQSFFSPKLEKVEDMEIEDAKINEYLELIDVQ